MDFMSGGSGSGEEEHEETSNSERGKKPYHRHTPQQIHHLETFFKDFPHPDEKQRCQLSRDLGLEPKQIKFWFQNKRTQMKAHTERTDNNVLKSENERMHYENLAMKDTLNNLICPTCNAKDFGEEDRQGNVQKLQTENALLKREYERLYNVIAPLVGRSSTLIPSPMLGSLTSLGQGMGVPSLNQESVEGEGPSMNITTSYIASRQEVEKSQMVETAAKAMNELLVLLQGNESLWIKASPNGRCFLDTHLYNKTYPRETHFKGSGVWEESSRDSAIVSMTAEDLFNIFLDSRKLMDLFPTIVTKARVIGTLDTGSLGGCLHLMYMKLHVLSPLVEPREHIFLRYSRNLDPGTWLIVDTSYDVLNKSRLQEVSFGSWRLPSGCLIQEMPSGKAKVTWVEHVQVEGKCFSDTIFTELIWSSRAFGAQRWIVSLQRMCERSEFRKESRTTTISGLEGVIDPHKGARSLMDLSHRMVKNFFEILSTPSKPDFGYFAKPKNSDIRVSVRENSGSGHPQGTIVCLATSLQLQVPYENLFDFFKDEKTRAQWDALSGGSGVHKMVHVATGAHPGNCIVILKPFYPKESTMMILQESCIDSLGGLVMYAPVDIFSVSRAIDGEDTTILPILPSGFVISRDDPDGGDGASTSSNVGPRRSILTVVFQILMSEDAPKELSMEIIENLQNLMSNSIAKIKVALGV